MPVAGRRTDPSRLGTSHQGRCVNYRGSRRRGLRGAGGGRCGLLLRQGGGCAGRSDGRAGGTGGTLGESEASAVQGCPGSSSLGGASGPQQKNSTERLNRKSRCRGKRERRLLLSWAKAGKDSKGRERESFFYGVRSWNSTNPGQ